MLHRSAGPSHRHRHDSHVGILVVVPTSAQAPICRHASYADVREKALLSDATRGSLVGITSGVQRGSAAPLAGDPRRILAVFPGSSRADRLRCRAAAVAVQVALCRLNPATARHRRERLVDVGITEMSAYWWGANRRLTPALSARWRSSTRAALSDHARPRVGPSITQNNGRPAVPRDQRARARSLTIPTHPSRPRAGGRSCRA